MIFANARRSGFVVLDAWNREKKEKRRINYPRIDFGQHISRDTVVSRAKYRAAVARHSVYLYASRLVESTRDYQTSITAERIEFLLGLIDSLGLNYIRKVSLFLLYMLYKHYILRRKVEMWKFSFKKRHRHRRHRYTYTTRTQHMHRYIVVSRYTYIHVHNTCNK